MDDYLKQRFEALRRNSTYGKFGDIKTPYRPKSEIYVWEEPKLQKGYWQAYGSFRGSEWFKLGKPVHVNGKKAERLSPQRTVDKMKFERISFFTYHFRNIFSRG